MKDSNLAKGDPLPNKMEINLNVLRVLMLDWVGGEINNTNVIAVDQCVTVRWVAKLDE
jgi:hypothetical protein